MHIEHFHLIGTNFTKADTYFRGKFAITGDNVTDVYELAKSWGIEDFFVLSTCNRTEFYACCPNEILELFVIEVLGISEDEIESYFYEHRARKAAKHLFKVVAGLDSQIIGDYEIVSQVKNALGEARNHKLLGTITDRVSNFAMQSSKKVKTNTNLSSGKYSVSYAAAQLLHHESQSRDINNILLVGLGKFGSSVAKNLREYFPDANLTLSNRTIEKTAKLADELSANVIPYDSFLNLVGEYDAIITTVGTDHYIINVENVPAYKDLILLDLSIPHAIDPAIRSLEGVKLLGVDEISQFHNSLLEYRKLEIPTAENIIEEYMGKLMEWHHVYQHRHVVLEHKDKINDLIAECQDCNSSSNSVRSKQLEKTFFEVVRQSSINGNVGCKMLEAINNVVAAEREL